MKLLKPIFYFLDTIRDDSRPSQIALSVLLGTFLAVNPLFTPQTALVLLALCVIRINTLALLLSLLFFFFLSRPLEPWFHDLGRTILVETPSLHRLWAGLYHSPVFTFTRFNNTVVMGSLFFFVVISVPLFLFTYLVYRRWSHTVLLAIQQSNLGLTIRATIIFRRYAEYLYKKSQSV